MEEEEDIFCGSDDSLFHRNSHVCSITSMGTFLGMLGKGLLLHKMVKKGGSYNNFDCTKY